MTLGGAGDPDSPSPVSTVSVDSRGNYYVTGMSSSGEIHVYDAQGRHQGVVGRTGEGPGEFRMPMARVMPGDTLFVVDPANLRLSVLAQDRRLVRELRIPAGFTADFHPLPGGEVLLLSIPYGGSAANRPLHRIGRTGEVLASFPESPDIRPPAPRPENRRAMAVAPNERVWLAARTRYVLEEWDLRGTKRRELVRTVPWFRTYAERTPDSPMKRRPDPALVGLHMDGSGRLWVRLHVASPEWKPSEDQSHTAPFEFEAFYNTIVEVIDPERGEVLASTRFSTFLMKPFGDNLTATLREEPSGNVVLDIWRMRLARQ